jgi:hypothetical protein
MKSQDLVPQVEFPVKARKHRWNLDEEKRIAGTEFKDGVGRTERVCIHCGLIRITMHPPGGFPWRAWRHPKSKTDFECQNTPPCSGEVRS